MNWTRTETLALAQQSCCYCFGLGLCASRGDTTRPCNCVFRAIFRACYARFQHCSSLGGVIGRVSLESNRGAQNKQSFSRRNEEYIADFCLVAKRVLGEGTLAYKIFKFHFLYGADYSLCVRQLKLERGEFFHEVYRVQQRLGRAFRELQPYALFPLDEYFSPASNGGVKSERAPAPALTAPLRVPLRAAA